MKSYENSLNKLSEREIKFNQARKIVDAIIDKVGTPVDEDIKETVAVLMAMDFITSSSCAGHTDEEEGYGMPYVEFYTPDPQGWKEDIQKQEDWRAENLKQRGKLMPLLTKFNQTRQTLEDAKLTLWNMGLYGAFRLQSEGKAKKIDELGIKTKEDLIDKIRLYQKEMSDFTDFLLKEYLNQKD